MKLFSDCSIILGWPDPTAASAGPRTPEGLRMHGAFSYVSLVTEGFIPKAGPLNSAVLLLSITTVMIRLTLYKHTNQKQINSPFICHKVYNTSATTPWQTVTVSHSMWQKHLSWNPLHVLHSGPCSLGPNAVHLSMMTEHFQQINGLSELSLWSASRSLTNMPGFV